MLSTDPAVGDVLTIEVAQAFDSEVVVTKRSVKSKFSRQQTEKRVGKLNLSYFKLGEPSTAKSVR